MQDDCHLRDHEALIRQRGEIHKPDPVSSAIEKTGRDLEAESRLAAAPRADECDEAIRSDELVELVQFL